MIRGKSHAEKKWKKLHTGALEEWNSRGEGIHGRGRPDSGTAIDQWDVFPNSL